MNEEEALEYLEKIVKNNQEYLLYWCPNDLEAKKHIETSNLAIQTIKDSLERLSDLKREIQHYAYPYSIDD